jgi:hypothetical protein
MSIMVTVFKPERQEESLFKLDEFPVSKNQSKVFIWIDEQLHI